MTSDGKIHVAHATQALEIGGLESFIVEFCRNIGREKFSTTVLCLNSYDDRYKKTLEQSGTEVRLIRKKHRYDVLFLLRAASFLRSRNVDILHVHGGCFFYGAVIGRLAGVKGLIYTAHGMPVTSGLQAEYEEFVSCLITDRIVAVSNEIANDLTARQKRFAGKVKVLVNGIDSSKFVPAENKKELMFGKASLGMPHEKKLVGAVGRLEKVKNYPLLLRAFAELVHFRNHDLHLAIVGTGSEEMNLKRLSKELCIADRVSFLGMRYDVQKIYPLFDVFVLPSLTEGTSLSLLEAQSCGVPAVVTDVGGNSNIIHHGMNGFLCPSNDYAALAVQLERVLGNDSEREAMKTASRKVMLERFDYASMIASYQEIYSEIGQNHFFGLTESTGAL
jgi:glycosyltransferase involved in cell wall biosynthesis